MWQLLEFWNHWDHRRILLHQGESSHGTEPNLWSLHVYTIMYNVYMCMFRQAQVISVHDLCGGCTTLYVLTL